MAPPVLEQLEDRLTPSQLLTLASFNGTNGSIPAGGVIRDTAGNLFGTTSQGGPSNAGTVFELAAGSSTITALASFNGTNGQDPNVGLIEDASGNLFGTVAGGGASGDGTVFEVAAGSGVITTLATFNGTNGANPNGALIEDASGNFFGTTVYGGTSNDGTVFKVAAGSHTLTTLGSFNGGNGEFPYCSLVEDGNGNLYGDAPDGGASGVGTMFEVVAGSGVITTLASFNVSNGQWPQCGLVRDGNGNLFGTAYAGGTSGDRTVFELAAGSSTIITLASFNGTNGLNPFCTLVEDGGGNLFGTANAGGDSSDGTVFEVAAGSGTITTLASFNGASGINPHAGLVADASGNLYGATCSGGANGNGTIFEYQGAGQTGPTVYNNAAQFSATSDPQGVWSYGYLAAPTSPETPNTSTFTLFPNHGHVQSSTIDYWWTNNGNADPQANHNPTNGTVTYANILWQPGQAAFHPGPHGEFADWRFTAPGAGPYALNAVFTGIDQAGSAAKDVHVLVNGTQLFGQTLAGAYNSTVSYATVVTLAQGDQVDFVLGYGLGPYLHDTTALNATLQLAPDISGVSASADGQTTLTLSYQIGTAAAAPFRIGLYSSTDAMFDASDTLQSTIPITDPADLSMGTHTKTFTIGTGAGQVALPGAGLPDLSGDYYLLAVANDNQAIVESSTSNNTAVFSGAYHLAGGDVLVQGTDGNDTITVAPAGTLDALTLNGTSVAYTASDVTGFDIRAHAGNDNVSGPQATQPMRIFGGAGNDTLTGGQGSDLLVGGAGNDIYVFKPATRTQTDTMVELPHEGTDTLDFSALAALDPVTVNLASATTTLASHTRRTVLVGAAGEAANFENVRGGAGNDLITGNAAANYLFGGPGNDTLQGGPGNDTLEGGPGNDSLAGGTGNDVYLFKAASATAPETDTLVENAGEGIDTLDFSALPASTPVTVNLASLTTTLATHANRTVLVAAAGMAANFENVFGGAGNDVLTGNAAGGILEGGGGDDLLTAGSGRTILVGGAGADTLIGGSNDDLLISGTTTFDKNLSALLSILAEWRSAKDYETRVSDLRNGGGLNGTHKLVWGSTVNDDNAADSLTGGAGLDWFFANLGPGGIVDTITDLNNGGTEHVNNG
jgi:uncharacterized repeat protein (TIGR03803 family)